MRDQMAKQDGWAFGEVLKISAPASMSGLNRVITQFVDGKMVAFLGSATVAGQGMGGLMAFMLESFARGALGVVNTYVSQNLGAGRFRRCAQYTWAGILLVLLFSAVLCPLAIIAPAIFSLIGHEANVQAAEVTYFRYMILCVPLTLSIRVIQGFFYGVHKPGIVYVVSVLASLLNIAGNWILIFGHFGAPALGLHGAAIASVASWAVQLIVLVVVFLSGRYHRKYGTRMARTASWGQCRQLLRIGLPSGGHTFMDIATWTYFLQVLVGHFGTQHLAAMSHAMRYMRISFIPMVGMGIAATVMVGKDIGNRMHDAARRHAYSAVIVAIAYMSLCAIVFTVFRKQMIGFFVADGKYSPEEAAELIRIGSRMLIFMAVFQTADGINSVFAGALRGAGDTRWPMWAIGIVTMGILVGGGSVLTWHCPWLKDMGPFVAAAATYIVSGVGHVVAFPLGGMARDRPAQPTPQDHSGRANDGPDSPTDGGHSQSAGGRTGRRRMRPCRSRRSTLIDTKDCADIIGSRFHAARRIEEPCGRCHVT